MELIVGGLPSLVPWLIAGVLALLTGLGIYRKGRKDVKSAIQKEELKQHERMNRADTGEGASDADNSEWLRKYGRKHGG